MYSEGLWDRRSPKINFSSGWCNYWYMRLYCKSAITTWCTAIYTPKNTDLLSITIEKQRKFSQIKRKQDEFPHFPRKLHRPVFCAAMRCVCVCPPILFRRPHPLPTLSKPTCTPNCTRRMQLSLPLMIHQRESDWYAKTWLIVSLYISLTMFMQLLVTVALVASASVNGFQLTRSVRSQVSRAASPVSMNLQMAMTMSSSILILNWFSLFDQFSSHLNEHLRFQLLQEWWEPLLSRWHLRLFLTEASWSTPWSTRTSRRMMLWVHATLLLSLMRGSSATWSSSCKVNQFQ